MTLAKFTRLLTLCTLALPTFAIAALPSLTVHVTNAIPSQGQIEVTLFNSAETFMVEVDLQESGQPDENGEFTATFVSLEEGEYAVVVVHDENDNKTYDSGILGFGSEGLGYSNNVNPWFSRPDFDDVKIRVEGESTEITVELN